MRRLRRLQGLALAALLSVSVSAELRAQSATLEIPGITQEGEELPPPKPQSDGSQAPQLYSNDSPLRLADAIRRSLANVQTVQANVAVQTATIGRFEALKQFVPLVSLPQLATGLQNFGNPGSTIIFPDVTGGTPLAGVPGDHAMLNRVFYSLPLDPAGQITALPIAEEGIRVKLLMEQLVRRSQAMLSIQDYFEAKQIQYGIRTGLLAVNLADEALSLTQRKLFQRQAHDVELTEARVANSKAHVFLADLEKESRIRQRKLAVVLHQSRLLIPQTEPAPIALDHDYSFDLGDPDLVDLGVVPDFPTSREEAVEMAKRQRVEIRILMAGLNIAQLRRKGSLLSLFGKGQLPGELGFKSTTTNNGGVALGAIFGTNYNAPVLDVGLWSQIRNARLDVVQSQLELEKALLDVVADAGDSWDRWRQEVQEWEQKEAELRLRRELLERQERLYQQKQSIWLDVLAAQVALLQADANRWTAWYNLQLARLDVLRSTELLLDYVEKANIADLTAWQQPPPDKLWHRWIPWLSRKESVQQSANPEGTRANP
jgi:outer membrane protein TolC